MNVAGKQFTYKALEDDLFTHLEVKDRWKLRGLGTYRKCFLGKDLVSLLVAKLGCASRQEATQAGDQMMVSGLFSPAEAKQNQFRDGNIFYRLQSNEVGLWKALNTATPPPENERTPLVLLRKLNTMLVDILSTHSEPEVDYVAVSGDPRFEVFCRAVGALRTVDLAGMDMTSRAAFVLNLYNMAVLHAFASLGVPRDQGGRLAFFNGVRYQLGGGTSFSLHDLESGILRGNRPPPYQLQRPFGNGDVRQAAVLPLDHRIHFALNCGAKACPPVRWYTTERLDEELRLAATAWVEQDENVSVNEQSRTLYLSRVCKWYDSDFGGTRVHIANTLLAYANGAKAAQLSTLLKSKFTIRYLPYNWSVSCSQSKNFSDYCYSCLVFRT